MPHLTCDLVRQVTTTTKVFREVHHIGPDGQVLEPGQAPEYYGGGPEYSPYNMDPYRPGSPASEQGTSRWAGLRGDCWAEQGLGRERKDVDVGCACCLDIFFFNMEPTLSATVALGTGLYLFAVLHFTNRRGGYVTQGEVCIY